MLRKLNDPLQEYIGVEGRHLLEFIFYMFSCCSLYYNKTLIFSYILTFILFQYLQNYLNSVYFKQGKFRICVHLCIVAYYRTHLWTNQSLIRILIELNLLPIILFLNIDEPFTNLGTPTSLPLYDNMKRFEAVRWSFGPYIY